MNIIKLIKNIFKKHKTTFICCPFCKSTETEYFDLKQINNNPIIIDAYKIKCNKCGAEGNIKKIWSKF